MSMKKILITIGFFALLVLLGFGCTTNATESQHSYAVLLGLNSEDSALLTSYDTVVIDAQYFTKDEIAVVSKSFVKVITR